MLDNTTKYSSNELTSVIVFANEYRDYLDKKMKPIELGIQSYNINKYQNRGQTEDIRKYILAQLYEAKRKGIRSLEFISGVLHKDLHLKNRMPSVCNAMITIQEYDFEILHDTKSGKSSTKKVRYHLQ